MRIKLILGLSLLIVWYSVSAAIEPKFVLKTPFGNIEAKKGNNYYYLSLDLAKPLPLSLVTNIQIESVEISPKSQPVSFSLIDNKVVFTLKNPGYHMIRINDSIRVFLFAEQPEKVPTSEQVVNIVSKYNIDPSGQTNETERIQQALNELSGSGKILLFPRGTYKCGQINIRSNSRIYLERGAELSADTSSIESYLSSDEVKTKRFISLNGVENIEISGLGSINGNGRILRTKFGDEARMRLLLAINSKNISINGLQLIDPGSWNTQILICDNVALRNIKLLNDTGLSNTDGFDPDGSKNMLIEHCFAMCSDDNVAIKTTGYTGIPGNVDKITVRGCLFLTRKSALKIGTETRGEIMKNITFENNDVLESDRGMSLYVSDGATLDSIVFRNNHFERNYPDAQRKAIHFVVSKRNSDSKLGRISNVLLLNNYFENSFPKNSLIKYEGEGSGIEVTIDNLVISGKKVGTLESARIQSTNAKITFK